MSSTPNSSPDSAARVDVRQLPRGIWVLGGVSLLMDISSEMGEPRDALVADLTPADLRGTAFGFFNLVSGLALLVASALAGWMSDRWGAPATFITGAGFCVLTLLGMGYRAWRSQAPDKA